MFKLLKGLLRRLTSTELRKASKLGLKDLGRPDIKLINTSYEYPIHGFCLKDVRIGETPEGKLVYWCPRCEVIIEEKGKAESNLRRLGYLPETNN